MQNTLCAEYQPGAQLLEYTVESVLGRGNTGICLQVLEHAFRCCASLISSSSHQLLQARAPDGQRVAIKVLSLRGGSGWKQVELFEREAKALRGLSHPCIPRYIDYREIDSPSDRVFVLMQVGLPSHTLMHVCHMYATPEQHHLQRRSWQRGRPWPSWSRMAGGAVRRTCPAS